MTITQPTHRAGSKQLIREINEALVLDVLRMSGPVPRARIAAATGLSPATVTGIVGHLVEQGFIRETDVLPSTGGRPAQRVALSPDRIRSIGVRLSSADAVGAAVDLTGERVGTARRKWRGGVEDAVAAVRSCIDKLRSTFRAGERLGGIGVAVSGVVDEGGVLRHSGSLGWNDVDIARELDGSFDVPVRVDRYVHSLASSLTLFGEERFADQLLVVNVEPSLGVVLTKQGVLQRGVHRAAGGLAHTRADVADSDGARCHCGRRGCLETLASEWGIRRALRESGDDIDPAAWRDADDPRLNDLLDSGGRTLGRALANLAKVIDPTRIIVVAPSHLTGVYMGRAGEAFRSELDANAGVEWVVRETDEYAAAYGAACEGIAHLFRVDLNSVD